MLKQKSKESNMNITNFSNTYRVSLLTSADVEIIYNLCIKNPIYYKYCPPTVTVDSIQSDMAALPPNKTMEDKYYVGYFDDAGNLIAVMDFIDKYPDERTAFIGFFMVNADFQGRGIGSFLISELFQYLKSQGYERIRLGYVEGNEQSRNFWLKNGFQDTGLRNQTDTYTVVVMNKDIIMRKKMQVNKIIDISQEVLSCQVYPGDPKPQGNKISSMEDGALYNLTEFSMCAHNGTHIDAPSHFLKDGKNVDQLSLEYFVGRCYLARHQGDVMVEDAKEILDKATAVGAAERILIAGDATITAEAARVFAAAGIKLIGNESQTVGPKDAPMEVHVILLGAGVVLLEGLVVKDVSEGVYFLNAAPLNLAGFEGAPCRAYLME